MIDNEFLQRIGLTEDQITLLRDRLDQVSRYRQILLQEGVSPKYVETIIRATKPEEVDLSNEDLLREKVRVEWDGMIVNGYFEGIGADFRSVLIP